MLTATGYAVLGVLSFGKALSGYDVKRWADHSLRHFFWSPAQSAIYTELRRLEELGYVRTLSPNQGPRGRHRYRITATGRQALELWVASSEHAPTVVKDHTLLKVWLGHLAERDSLIELVESDRRATEELMEQLRCSAPPVKEGEVIHAALVARCCERLAAARAEALQELAAGLNGTCR